MDDNSNNVTPRVILVHKESYNSSGQFDRNTSLLGDVAENYGITLRDDGISLSFSRTKELDIDHINMFFAHHTGELRNAIYLYYGRVAARNAIIMTTKREGNRGFEYLIRVILGHYFSRHRYIPIPFHTEELYVIEEPCSIQIKNHSKDACKVRLPEKTLTCFWNKRLCTQFHMRYSDDMNLSDPKTYNAIGG